MAPVIWGLPLSEIRASKFKSSNMWSEDYHLRRTKFIVYQLAMILCVVSESLGTAAMSDYRHQQDFVESHAFGATVLDDDYVGAAAFNVFVGVFVATIFGAAFFFDLIWPERHESRAVKLAWRMCAVLAAIMALASALTLTIITATRSAALDGPDAVRAARALRDYAGSPLTYRDNGRAVAACAFIWPGWLATVASAAILWRSYGHNDRLGPLSTRARKAREADGAASADTTRPHSPAADVEAGVPMAPVRHATMTAELLDPNIPHPGGAGAGAAPVARFG